MCNDGARGPNETLSLRSRVFLSMRDVHASDHMGVVAEPSAAAHGDARSCSKRAAAADTAASRARASLRRRTTIALVCTNASSPTSMRMTATSNSMSEKPKRRR